MPRQSSSPSAPAGGQAVPIEMPRLSGEEGSAILSSWLVSVGDAVEQGGIIAELETDKATVELEAPVEGRIEALLVAAGTEGLKPGALLGRITPTAVVAEARGAAAVASAEAAPRPADTPASKPADTPAARRATTPSTAPSTGTASAFELPGRARATPLARRVAETHGIDLAGVTGTGVGGRIEKADVERTATAPLAAPRAPVAARTESAALLEAPRAPAHLSLRCAMDAILAARIRLNENLGAARREARISLNDFIVRAAAQALHDVPEANLRRVGPAVERAEAVDVAVVAGTETGPVTLIVRDADRKGLAVLSEELRRRVAQARAGEAQADDGSPATLLITSFARFGIESAHPMLPRDQVCLLGVGAVREEPVVRDGALAVGSTVSLTLAFDPTAVGGAVAARLLGTVRRHLEDPLGMML